MHYQLAWTTLPGLRGLSCSEFRAVPTEGPDNERGVAVELANEAEREALIAELERHIAKVRFSNNATAFETVKALSSKGARETVSSVSQLSRRRFFGLCMGTVAGVWRKEGRSEPWRIDRLRVPELQQMAERLGCFDLTDQMPRDRNTFLAHVMTYGKGEDLAVAKKHFSDLEFVEALKYPPVEVFDRYSWAYWNTVFGRVPVPPMPKCKFLGEDL